jgi:hypothetical protein
MSRLPTKRSTGASRVRSPSRGLTCGSSASRSPAQRLLITRSPSAHSQDHTGRRVRYRGYAVRYPAMVRSASVRSVGRRHFLPMLAWLPARGRRRNRRSRRSVPWQTRARTVRTGSHAPPVRCAGVPARRSGRAPGDRRSRPTWRWISNAQNVFGARGATVEVDDAPGYRTRRRCRRVEALAEKAPHMSAVTRRRVRCRGGSGLSLAALKRRSTVRAELVRDRLNRRT